MREVAEISKELKTGVNIHFSEVEEDVKASLLNYGVRPTFVLEKVGLLNRNVVLNHGVWVDEDEMRLIARTRTNVSYNPCSNMKLASGVAKIPEMIKLGVNVSLGTDGGPSNNTYDLLREMKHAVLLQSIAYMNPAVIRAEDVIEMATINGAKALMIDHLVGSIEVGKKADIIIIDYWQPHLIPMNNPVSHI
ncbi:MAG: amidohydrolase family protein, partial [Zestosphaera sp.]